MLSLVEKSEDVAAVVRFFAELAEPAEPVVPALAPALALAVPSVETLVCGPFSLCL